MKKNFFCALLLLAAYAGLSQDIKKIRVTELEQTITASKTPLVVNFWATYCIPCIEEIPYFQEIVKKYEKDSVTLLLVSLDLKEDYDKIKPFAAKRKFWAPIVWLNESDADYFCPKVDPKWSGAVPATLFVNNKNGYRKFYEEQMTAASLEKEIMATLGRR